MIEPTARITRGQLLAAAGMVAVPIALGTRVGPAWARRSAAAPLRGSLVASSAELTQVHANVFDLQLGFARRAWENTLEQANNWLGYRAKPPRDDVRVTNWNDQIYRPGLHDGNAAYTLGLAYALAGREEHGRRSRDICLAWARTYRKSRPQSEIGHMVAEPVGPVIKLCMAFQLARPAFSSADAAEFALWAGQFVEKGKRNADSALDSPWVPDVVYGGDRTNVAPYGNSATWQRAMAVWAATAVDSGTLRSTLDWNLSHTTAGGRPYGWDELLEGLVIDGAGGQLTEDRYRQSVEYGMFSWSPLVLIADVARRAGYKTNLFTYKSRRNGYTLLTPILDHYARFLTVDTIAREDEKTDYGGDWRKASGRWRAFWEIAYRNSSDPPVVKTLRRVVNHGGPDRRGDNYDIYITNYAALLGRGPKGPMPAAPKPKPPAKKKRRR